MIVTLQLGTYRELGCESRDECGDACRRCLEPVEECNCDADGFDCEPALCDACEAVEAYRFRGVVSPSITDALSHYLHFGEWPADIRVCAYCNHRVEAANGTGWCSQCKSYVPALAEGDA